MSVTLQSSCFRKIRQWRESRLCSPRTVLSLVCKQVHTKSTRWTGACLTTPRQHHANHWGRDNSHVRNHENMAVSTHFFFFLFFRSGLSVARGCQLTQRGAFLFGLENLQSGAAGVKSLQWFVGVESTYGWPQASSLRLSVSTLMAASKVLGLKKKKSHDLHFDHF